MTRLHQLYDDQAEPWIDNLKPASLQGRLQGSSTRGCGVTQPTIFEKA